MSSRKLESGVVEVSGCGYTWAAPGHRLYVIGFDAGAGPGNDLRREFASYLARLALSQNGNGRAWHEGVRVKPPEGALLEAVANGSVHPSLVEEPRAA